MGEAGSRRESSALRVGDTSYPGIHLHEPRFPETPAFTPLTMPAPLQAGDSGVGFTFLWVGEGEAETTSGGGLCGDARWIFLGFLRRTSKE